MSIEADFTPPGVPPETTSAEQVSAFPLSTSLNIIFNAYEDRLVLRSRRVNRDPVNVLLTRRMTIIVLAQLLVNLPELSGLDKTPAQYWQEVLHMAHQTALKSGRGAREQAQAKSQESGATSEAAQGGVAQAESGQGEAAQGEATQGGAGPDEEVKRPRRIEGDIYLATSLTMQRKGDQLILALSGLPMPCAMTEPCEREALFAIPLQVEHVHQLIQLLIDKAQEADWHLPLNLPWLESPSDAPAATVGLVH